MPTAALPLQVGCYGHAPGDVVLSGDSDSGSDSGSDSSPLSLLPLLPADLLPLLPTGVTNGDVLQALVAASSGGGRGGGGGALVGGGEDEGGEQLLRGALPYVYADFEWPHCAGSEEHDIRGLLPKRGGEASRSFSSSSSSSSSSPSSSSSSSLLSSPITPDFASVELNGNGAKGKASGGAKQNAFASWLLRQ